jgi:hypothetical protein
MPTSTRRRHQHAFARLPLIIAVVAVLVIAVSAWLFTCQISGEAFVVRDGKVISVPGARIIVKQISADEENQLVVRKFQLSTEFQQQAIDAIKTQINNTKMPSDEYEEYEQFQKNASQIRLSFVLSELVLSVKNNHPHILGYSDRKGHFVFHVPPGRYAIALGGQAAKEYVTWLDTANVLWRTEIHLVEPDSAYLLPQ